MQEEIPINIGLALSSSLGLEPIFLKLITTVGLQFLKGERTQDIRDWAGILTSSYHCCCNLFINKILMERELDIIIPQTTRKIDKVTFGFKEESNKGDIPVFTRCVGVIDGILVQICRPINVDNPNDYFSGHYDVMGINIQAICNHNCQLLYIATAGPGDMPDIATTKECRIIEIIKTYLQDTIYWGIQIIHYWNSC